MACTHLHTPAPCYVCSWDLLNEPRCKYCPPAAVDAWYGALADHVKVSEWGADSHVLSARAYADWLMPMRRALQSVDPNHLITTGEEGFFDESDPAS